MFFPLIYVNAIWVWLPWRIITTTFKSKCSFTQKKQIIPHVYRCFVTSLKLLISKIEMQISIESPLAKTFSNKFVMHAYITFLAITKIVQCLEYVLERKNKATGSTPKIFRGMRRWIEKKSMNRRTLIH